MNFKIIYSRIKKNAVSVLLISFLLLITFSPDAKSWLLQQLVSIGLFKAAIKKEAIEKAPLAASFSYTDKEGKIASTVNLKGKVIFINFWASWCPPCRAEMPSIVALYRKLQNDSRYVFLFMNEDDDKIKAAQFLEKNQYNIPLYSPSGNIPVEIFGGTLPTTIVINTEGKIALKHEGIAGYNSKEFIKQLNELK